jgi:hypothetical protein
MGRRSEAQMIGTFFRLFVIGFVALSVVYAILRWFTASLRREALEKEFDADNPDEETEDRRAVYVEAGMQRYRASFRRKALILVYIIPLILYFGILYLNNFY